jgi:cytoskeletal protein RodZ
MTNFTAHQVLSEYKTIGDQLRLARLEKGWTIARVAVKLKVKPEYVKALEEEDYKKIPGGLYGKIFLKKYVHCLGLDYKTIVRHFVKDRQVSYHGESDVFSKKVVARSQLAIFPKIFRNGLVALVILVCFLYLGFYLKKITAPPFLTVTTPAINQVQTEFTAIVSGETELESEVYINGQMILIDRQGKFSQEISLKKGVNIIVIKAKKKYSREKSLTRQILVE